jgi:hypothetical protein
MTIRSRVFLHNASFRYILGVMLQAMGCIVRVSNAAVCCFTFGTVLRLLYIALEKRRVTGASCQCLVTCLVKTIMASKSSPPIQVRSCDLFQFRIASGIMNRFQVWCESLHGGSARRKACASTGQHSTERRGQTCIP